MPLKRSKLPNQLLILANTEYLFGEVKHPDDFWRVTHTFDCDGAATVYITTIGTFGFIFPDSSSLASIDILKYIGSGHAPQEVMDNDDDIHYLQDRRMLFINFIVAAFFGRIIAMAHTAITGAFYSGQDKITAFALKNNALTIQRTEFLDQFIGRKILALKAGKLKHRILAKTAIDDGISYVKHLLQRHKEFAYADLKSCILMNYQAAILHNQQQASASFALNFSVIESLAREVLLAYGFVDGIEAQYFATNSCKISNKVSKKTFKNMKLSQVFEMLGGSGLLDSYLYQRLEDARKKRNSLMHKGVVLDPRESGDLQSAVRDIWALLIDSPFELNAGWAYRR